MPPSLKVLFLHFIIYTSTVTTTITTGSSSATTTLTTSTLTAQAKMIVELVKTKHGFPSNPAGKCHIVTFHLDRDTIQSLIDSFESDAQFIHINRDSRMDFEGLRRSLYADAWCVFVVVVAGSKDSLRMEAVYKVIEVVHFRKFIFLSDSEAATKKIPTRAVNAPSFIIEKRTSTTTTTTDVATASSTTDVATTTTASSHPWFYLHLGCMNCFATVASKVDIYSSRTGFLIDKTNYFGVCCNGKTELYGHRVQISAFGAIPFIGVDVDPVTQEETPVGIDVDIVSVLARKFQFNPFPVKEKSWGDVDANGSWTGTIGSVASGASKLGIGHVSITWDRYQVIDYSVPTYLVEYGHFSNRPKILHPFLNIIKPFDGYVWACLGASIVLTGATMLVFYRAYEALGRLDHLPFRLGKVKHGADFLLIPLAMLVDHREEVKWFRRSPRNSAGSLLTLVWALATLILTLSYWCTLQACLIAVEYERPIDTVQDILLRDEDLWYIKGTSLLEDLETSPLKEIRDLYKQVLRHHTLYDYEGELPLTIMDPIVASGKGSFIAFKVADTMLRGKIARHYGYYPLHFAKQTIISVYAGIAVPKHCLFVDHINRALTGMNEFGIIDYFFNKNSDAGYAASASDASRIKREDGNKPLQLITFVSPLAFLVIMHVICFMVFLWEWVGGVRDARREKRKENEKGCHTPVVVLDTSAKLFTKNYL